jgi:hypothetical protein
VIEEVIFVGTKNYIMIRKASLVAGCVLLSLMVSAQFKKGMIFTGGNVASALFDNSEKEVSYPAPTEGFTLKEKNFDIALTPFIGKFISDRTAIGGGIVWRYSNNNTSYKAANGNTFREDEETTGDIGLMIFARSYFRPGESPLNVYGQLSINAGLSSLNTEGFVYGIDYKDTYEGKSSRGFFFTPGLGVGISKPIGERVAIELGFLAQYRFSKYDVKTTTLRDEFMNGSIDQTFVNEPSYNEKKKSLLFNLGFTIFLDKLSLFKSRK